MNELVGSALSQRVVLSHRYLWRGMVGNSANRGCVDAVQIWKDFGSPVARGSPGRAVDCAFFFSPHLLMRKRRETDRLARKETVESLIL